MTALLAKAGHAAGTCSTGWPAALMVTAGLALLAFALWTTTR
jgi:hypothetical protein